jgi:hypothetical protein
MQKELDAVFQIYNYSRPHQRLNMNGRIPYEVFKSGAI